MDRLIYTSLTAMKGAMARQTAVANNLANAQTAGFRADISDAQALWLRGPGFDSRAVSPEEVLSADMTPGPVNATGRPLDIALSAGTLLAVQAEDGDEAYTRRGDLDVAASGLLVTGDGRPVLGQQGPITLPPFDQLSIDRDGRIMIVPPGGDPAAPQEAGTLKLVVPSGLPIAKGLDGLFRPIAGGTLPIDPEADLKTGHLEGSNVSATLALVDMIEASRSWDAQLKLLSEARDIDSATADLMRLPE